MAPEPLSPAARLVWTEVCKSIRENASGKGSRACRINAAEKQARFTFDTCLFEGDDHVTAGCRALKVALDIIFDQGTTTS